MAKFGEVLFDGSRFMFKALSPFLVLFIIAMTAGVDDWRSQRALLVIVCDVTATLLISALYNAKRFSWAGRTVTGIVFLAYVAYLVDEDLIGKTSKLGPR